VKSRIVLSGPPGFRKTTQAKLIPKRFNTPPASTGAILRIEASAQTPLGPEAQRVMI